MAIKTLNDIKIGSKWVYTEDPRTYFIVTGVGCSIGWDHILYTMYETIDGITKKIRSDKLSLNWFQKGHIFYKQVSVVEQDNALRSW